MRMRTSGGGEVRLERSERTLRQQRPAGRATKWRVILYHRPNSKSLLNEQAFLHLQLMRMRTSGGGEVRLERSERTLRQQRPAGRATKWRVILYHRPNSKSLLSEQAFLHLKPMRMRTSGGWEVRLDVDTVMACKFFPGPVSRIAGMPDTAPSGAVFFIPSAIFTPLPDYAVTHRTARLTSALHTPPVPACASSRRESPFLSCH
ncbi:hypothetical protein JRT77AECX_JRT77AEC_03122 [Escherichia coli]|nr:hypothetical protein JRT77AECX_JRT77AEC_03122 [Escherichia coli]